jgi:uroporphyrinogen decarboxylase
MKDVVNYKLPDPVDNKRFEGLHEKAKNLYEKTEYALIGANAASLNYLPAEIIGFQEYMEKLMLEPDIIEYLTDRVLEWFMRFFDRYLDEIGDYIEMIWMGDDWGTQLGPIVAPGVFEQIFIPRYKKFTDFVKSKSNIKIVLHSCGSVKWAMPFFIEAGIDVLHPLQGDAQEMDNPGELKEKFGKKLAFYSNIRNQSVIVNGTHDDVQNEVRTKITNLAPGGGYIFSAGHNIQADVPPQNIITLFDSAFKFGQYPIK